MVTEFPYYRKKRETRETESSMSLRASKVDKEPITTELGIKKFKKQTNKSKGMKIKGIYKELQKEENYIKAYEEIKSKSGNMTPGIDKETLQGMSKEWIRETIKTIKDCSFKFKPSKRIYIPKKNGKLRPLGIPSPRDKIIQKIILNILTEYYEEKFQETSHGYRPGRSCKTALKEVRSWKGIT